MTGFPSAGPERASERGMALVAALLLMMVMSGLAIALLASGRIETAMGDNEELYAGARAASEAGLNHTAADHPATDCGSGLLVGHADQWT